MIFDVSYWTRVGKRILYVVFLLIGLVVALKLSIFYMPFLVAFISVFFAVVVEALCLVHFP